MTLEKKFSTFLLQPHPQGHLGIQKGSERPAPWETPDHMTLKISKYYWSFYLIQNGRRFTIG